MSKRKKHKEEDIVARLRDHLEDRSVGGFGWCETPDVCTDAAEEIERLRLQVTVLRDVLGTANLVVEKWCHRQGNTQALFAEYVHPITQALSDTAPAAEAYRKRVRREALATGALAGDKFGRKQIVQWLRSNGEPGWAEVVDHLPRATANAPFISNLMEEG